MQALMGKNAKPPTPQELYRARKQKEEEEKGALLPPGFVNHGNTCFMNSVLQGLMATPMLADIVRFTLPETFSPILSRRSPQLTNGHGLGGSSEREWVDEMPLGDTFVVLMYNAWRAQDERKRTTMSPKELLSKIGAKHDQYMDFRQQDAHELLRHLLDAMRMEEMDVIKHRQPLPPKVKRKRKSKVASASNSPIPGPSSVTPEPTSPAEEDRLVSFVDMVFGGELASILVCEKCKKVSLTYEGFDDLSLPIKQDEYEKGRKRDKIRSLARKFGLRGRVSVRDLDVPEGPRSSSVPSSPLRRSEEAEKSFEIILNDRDARRLSLEHGDIKPPLPRKITEEVIVDEETNHSDAGREDDKRYLSASGRDGSPKDKDEDSWVKLRRRLSAGVKKGSKRRRSKEIQRENHPATIEESDATPEVDESFVEVKAPTSVQASPAASPKIGAGLGLTRFPFPRRASSRADSASPAVSVKTTPVQTPDDLPPVLPSRSRPTSPSVPSLVNGHSATHPAAKANPLRASNPSRADSQYLKRLLADVPAPSATSFNLFKNVPLANSSPDISDLRGSWPKAGHVQSIEGCLRMFTAVEMLEGENMVGCRRCWKIQHGQYVTKGAKLRGKDDADSEDEDCEPPSSASSASVRISLVDDEDTQRNASASNSPLLSSDVSERQSLRSISTDTLSTSAILSRERRASAPVLKAASSDSPSLPSILMTAPEIHATPASESTLVVDSADVDVNGSGASATLHMSPSRDSLQLPSPQIRHARMPAERSSLSLSLSSDASSVTSAESSDDEHDETETSLTASVRSEESVASAADPRQEVSVAPSSRDADARKESKSTKAKQVVLRRAFKRYLISKPPPVLVVHLKRFQQTGRSPTQYYSIANLSKMDDPVSFSEYLDISPFLLPKKDTVGSKKGNEEAVTSEVGCIYRLYAVVVHIGNMLGGHYISYVALPDSTDVSNNTPSLDAVSLSSDSASRSIDSQQSLSSSPPRPQVPRTTSFARTANPPAAHKDKSRTSHSAPPGAQRQWCYVSDTSVRLVALEEVLQSKAYICMYERLYL